MIRTLIVLGGTGDLAGRLLFPALADSSSRAASDAALRVVGAGVESWTEDEYRALARERLARHAGHLPPTARENFAASLVYQQVDVRDETAVKDALTALVDSTPGPVAIYLALPTQLMISAVRAAPECRLPSGSRIVLEKPFGSDLATAVELNAALGQFDPSTPQSAVYRVDHALAMSTVHDLPLAFGPDPGVRIVWSAERIARVELLWEETLALEGRAAFYDRAGALRDVMQNHLLQVLCVIAQTPYPAPDGVGGGAKRRAELLRQIRPVNATAMTARGRYTAGQLADDGAGTGGVVPDYAAERGVDPSRNTETWAQVRLDIDSAQWAGTAFVLRAGKALAARRRGVELHFRPEEDDAEEGQEGSDRRVWLDLDRPGGSTAPAVEPEPAAYRRIVDDVLSGGSEYAVSGEEAELSWQVFQPVLRAWAADSVPLLEYPAGSQGPVIDRGDALGR